MRWVLTCLLALAGCLQDSAPATAIDVSVKSDLQGDELAAVVYQIFARGADPTRDAPVGTWTAQGAERERPFVIEQGQQPELMLVVRGSGSQGSVAYTAFARFEEQKTLALPVYLGRACLARACDAGQTCFGRAEDGGPAGTCGPIPTRTSLQVVRRPGDESAWQPPTSGSSPRPAGTAVPSSPSTAAATTPTAPPGTTPTSTPTASGCAAVPGGACDPVRNCGCAAGQHCQVRDGAPVCATPGPKPADAVCVANAECGAGLVCGIARTCAAQCRADQDCGGGRCVKQSDQTYGSCLARCASARDCPIDVPCTPLRWGAAPPESLCFRPLDDCPYVGSGACDEPDIGTGLCGAQRDREDCSCDLVSQRGCPADQACQVEGIRAGKVFNACIAPGTKPVGSLCQEASECQRGHSCVSRLCHQFCNSNADCGTNRVCIRVFGGDGPEAAFQVCRLSCELGGSEPCLAGSSCQAAPNTAPTNAVCVAERAP